MTFISVSDLLLISKWLGITTIVLGAVTTISFILGWSWRFRLVGVTSFMGVLTGSFFGLGVSLYPRIAVEGAERFKVVYDNSGAQVVVALPAQAISEESLAATLKQAAYDSYSPGRFSQTVGGKMTVRARAIVHTEPGVSQPLLLGEVKRSMALREDDAMEIEIFSQNLAQLPDAP
jgi:hypothetical protein